MTKTYEEKIILEILENSEEKLTPLNLIKKAVDKAGISQRKAKKFINELTAQKELYYTCFYGSTYIELSFNKPVEVTEHFVLIPAGITETNIQDKINIFIEPGISFGSGSHPTTRLSLEALDILTTFKDKTIPKFSCHDKGLSGLDIGTGSGVLAIAACKALISDCVALDIDPNSLSEAKRNVRLNNLHNHISVSDNDLEILDQKFSLIIANLRYPTLKQLSKKITCLSKKNSVLIMSGVRTWEKNDLINFYSEKGFKIFWEKDEKNWSCVAMQRNR
jgi:ribosomal protein L11 methyltransferase